MKKKVFFQISIILYLLLLLLFVIIVGAIFGIVFVIKDIATATPFEWVSLVCCFIIVGFIGYTFIRLAKNRIILGKRNIFVPENWGSREIKLQYKTVIKYDEIEDIFLISSVNNSLNKSLNWGVLPMTYIVFKCNDDSQKAINVFYYSKKQIIKIINEAILRAQHMDIKILCKTGEEILSEFLVLQNKKK